MLLMNSFDIHRRICLILITNKEKMIFKKNLIMGGDHLHKSDSYSTEFMISSADDLVLDWMKQEEEFVAFKWKGNLAS